MPRRLIKMIDTVNGKFHEISVHCNPNQVVQLEAFDYKLSSSDLKSVMF